MPEIDSDLDGVVDCIDSCPAHAGPQGDSDADGQGDACDCAPLNPEVGSFSGATRYVNPTGDDTENDCLDWTMPCQTIAHALAEANAFDAISLSSGTFAESALSVAEDILIFGVGADVSVIDAQQVDRVLSITNGISATICSVAVINGLALGGDGGGILNEGTATLFNTRIANNVADQGAGIRAVQGTTTTLLSSTVEENAATQIGGGIANDGTLTVTDSTFRSNTAVVAAGAIGNFGTLSILDSNFISNSSPGPAGAGGAIATGMPVTITTSLFDANSAGTGGAIAAGASVSITGSTVSNNTAVSFGGGIASGNSLTVVDSSIINNSVGGSGGGINSDGNVTVMNSTISGNSAGEHGGGVRQASFGFMGPLITFENSTVANNTAGSNGGGLALFPDVPSVSSARLTNSTFSGNSAMVNGGGIFAENNTEVDINNSTVAENSAALGGGIYKLALASATSFHSIIGNNSSNDCATDAGNVFVLANFSLFSDNSCTFSGGMSNLPSQNPMLAPLADNGGPTETHALLLTSPAIDAGDLSCVVTSDQRGQPRPVNQCDIGAFEVQP